MIMQPSQTWRRAVRSYGRLELLREAWWCFLTVCLWEKLHFCPFLSILKGCVTGCTTHFQRLSGKKEQQVFSSWLWLCAYAISIPTESSGNSQISKVMLWGTRVSGKEGSLLNLEINLWRPRSGLTLLYHCYITRRGLRGAFLCRFHGEEWHAIHTGTSKPRLSVLWLLGTVRATHTVCELT